MKQFFIQARTNGAFKTLNSFMRNDIVWWGIPGGCNSQNKWTLPTFHWKMFIVDFKTMATNNTAPAKTNISSGHISHLLQIIFQFFMTSALSNLPSTENKSISFRLWTYVRFSKSSTLFVNLYQHFLMAVQWYFLMVFDWFLMFYN